VNNLAVSPDHPKAFLQGLFDLGYVEGRNLVMEYRSAEGELERLPACAAGRHVTGLAFFSPELVGKCLEQLKQAVPEVRQIGALWQPGGQGEFTGKDALKAAEVAGRALGVRLQFVEARSPADFERAFSEMTRARAGALTVLPSNMFINERRRLVDLAAKNRLPAVYSWREFVDVGGLMSLWSQRS
jgi:putative ABC transport system substrate-binding protein